MTEDTAEIAAGLCDLEKEFLTGWQGPRGACFNVIATGLVRRGLLKGPLDWTPSVKGEAVRDYLKEHDHD
jgi:hypothetical protein